MLNPMTDKQKTMIANNVYKVILSKNINFLTKQSYDFLNNCIGFIAHYDLYGFRDYYEDTNTLAKDILDNAESNQWVNFFKGENDYDYYMAKKELYNRLVKLANDELFPMFARAG